MRHQIYSTAAFSVYSSSLNLVPASAASLAEVNFSRTTEMAGGHGPNNTGGVRPMPIEGRLGNERERLRGMPPVERSWRRQWLLDQELSANEPREVPEIRRELINPIRRFYQKPLDVLCNSLAPTVGQYNAAVLRSLIPKLLMGIAAAYAAHYYFKYNQNDWTSATGWAVFHSRERSVPGDPGYPRVSDRNHPSDYCDKGFKNRKVFLD